MALDSFIGGPAAAAARLRSITAGYEEWSDGQVVLRWRGACTDVAIVDGLAVVATTATPRPLAQDGLHRILGHYERHGSGFLDRVDEHASGIIYKVGSGDMCAFRDLAGGGTAVVSADGLVATDVETLLGALTDPRPDPLWIGSILQNQLLDPCATAYAGVSHVKPGCVATFRHGTWEQQRAARWRKPSRASFRTEPRATAEFAELLKAAIRRQVSTAERAAVMLSGGQDSSLLMALAVEAAPSVEWRAYCIPFYAAVGDERGRQEAIASHLGVPITWVDVSGRSPLGDPAGPLFGGRAGPPFVGNWSFGAAVAAQAERDGTAVVIDGEDADSLLTGDMTYLPDLLIRGRWRRLYREAGNWDHWGVPRKTALRDAVQSATPPRFRRFVGDLGFQPSVSQLMASALAEQIGLHDRLKRISHLRWTPGRQFATARFKAVEADGIPTVLREAQATWRHWEPRLCHPFADRAVIEFALRLPWALMRGRSPKRIVGLATRGRLPDELVGRISKADLSEYWDEAVFRFDRERVGNGLTVAKRYPELVDATTLGYLEANWKAGQNAWMAGRVAALGLWLGSFGEEISRNLAQSPSAR